MQNKIVIFIILFSPFITFSQTKVLTRIEKRKLLYSDSNYYTSQKNIFRLTITQPPFQENISEPAWILAGNYEHPFTNKVSLSIRSGIGTTSYNNFAKYSLHITGSAEFRYFYAIEKRGEKYRPTFNMSGGYFAIEENFLTKPITSNGLTNSQTISDYIRTCLNVGYQRQYRKLYFNSFIGVMLFDALNNSGGGIVESLNAGITFGYVF